MEDVYDLLGVGFGPAGIALAAAIEDHFEVSSERRPAVIFLESQPDTRWQRGMLMRETDIQHHYLRDLATPRNPRSRFTFPNYLKEHGRLFKFGELAFGASGGAVGRVEWSDYVTWVARQLRDYVLYDEEVLRVEQAEGRRNLLRVVTRKRAFLARNVVVCLGRKPYVPDAFLHVLGEHAFHSSVFLQRAKALVRDERYRFALVGSGQNAIEILSFLHGNFPESTVASLHRSIGFRQVDLNPFSNEIFHPEEVDFFHSLSLPLREAALEDAKATNYSTVDLEASEALYRKVYEDWVVGKERIRFMKRSVVNRVARNGDEFVLHGENTYTGAAFELAADVIVLCTGFTEEKVPACLGPVRGNLVVGEDGGIVVDRNYRIRTKHGSGPGLYVGGISERSHGISDSTSFSMMALKAERLFNAFMDGFRAEQHAVPYPGARTASVQGDAEEAR